MASNRKFNVPINLLSLASDPASADEGDVYYNTTDDRVRVYKNSTWVNLAYADDVGIVSTDYITFDTTPEATIPATAGTVSWDSGESGLNVTLNSNVDLKLGQENVVLVANQTGSSISKGKVVYINGAAGQRPTINLSDADTEATSSKTLGLTAETIADGAEGFVTTFGVLRGVNTDGLTEGAMLWLSSTAGGYTTTIPAEPAHSVFLGYVVKASLSAGEIFVNVQNGYELNELHGVQIEADDNIVDNEVLAWDDASGLWKNQTSAEAGLIDTSSTAQSKTGNFTAAEVHATVKLVGDTVGGDEGGEILLGKPETNTTIAGTGVTIDVWQNKLRFFEQGGSARGYYIDITGGGAGVGTNLVGGGSASDSFKTISVSGQSDVVADSSTDTLTLVAGSNVTITTNATSDSITIAATDTNTVTNAFTTISTPSGTSPVADSTSDTLTLTAGTGITITGDATTDSITIASTITDTNTTYDLTSTGTSTASINLVPSSGATDSITITGSGATTVSHSAGAITISSSDTNTTYSPATSTVAGLIELFSDTVQSTAANAVTSTASRTYGIQVNSSGQGVVNVPWSDTDTNYYPSAIVFNAGTTAGPTLDLTMSGTGAPDITAVAIPSASASASGVVTTGAQTFAGDKTFNGTTVLGDAKTDTVSTYGNLTVGLGNTLSTDTSKISITSAGFSGLEILGDTANTAGEPGGAYVRFGLDNWTTSGVGTSAIVSMVNSAGTDGAGSSTSGTTANSLLIENSTASSGIHFSIAGNTMITLTSTELMVSSQQDLVANSATAPDTTDGTGVRLNTGGTISAYNQGTGTAAVLGLFTDVGSTRNRKMYVSAAGDGYFDGVADSAAADYAEYFEWEDGNPNNEDRVGKSVVLSSNSLIRFATSEDNPNNIIGIISARPAFIGDSAWNNWDKKYAKDRFNRPIISYTDVTSEIWELNPEFDPSQEYVRRSDRPEWSPVGLVGKLRVFKTEPKGSRWIKLRDIDDEIEEWLVR